MRVLLLSTTGKVNGAWVEDVVAPLEGRHTQLAIVLLDRPAERLPVDRCFHVGKRLRPGHAVRDVRTVSGPRPEPVPSRRITRAVDRIIAKVVPRRWLKDRNLLFAMGTAWSRPIRAEFARADLVIALDWNTTWAAWLLARRVAGPHVVFGVDGALLKLAEVEATRSS